jgi:hypothetical protein
MGLLTTLLEKLKVGEVTFLYRKSNGKVRKAVGTLSKERIPREDWLSVKNPHKNDENSIRLEKTMTYYDLVAGEWRKFKILSLLRILSSKEMKTIKKERKDFNLEEL